MLCGLKRQHQTSPSNKRWRPLNCMATNDPEPSYKSLTTTKTTKSTTKRLLTTIKSTSSQRPRPFVQQSILTGTEIFPQGLEDKENLPKALSKLQLIGKNSNAFLPVDLHTEEMLGRVQFDQLVDNESKSSWAQSTQSLVTNASSLPTTMKRGSPTSHHQRQPCKKIRTDVGSMTTLSNTASVAADILARYRTSSKGNLHLRLSSKGNTLSIDVLEAKNVRSSWSSVANAFVKVQICPDSCKGSTYETRAVMGTNQPTFAQLIAINLKTEDVTKRLVVSVWHRDTKKSCSEFLGCLSFGLKHLIHKTRHGRVINGWYHVLPESIGHRKHILVENEEENQAPVVPSQQSCDLSTPAKSTKAMTPSVLYQTNNETLLEKDELIVKTLKIHFNSGYGFTVRNTRPITVGRVKKEGAACNAGLHSGDVVTKINGKNLDKYSAEEAALMVRYSKEFVIVEVQCPHYRESMKDYFDNYMKPWNKDNNGQVMMGESESQRLTDLVTKDSELVKEGSNHSEEGKVSSKEIWELYHKQRRVSGDGEVNDTGFTEDHTTQQDSDISQSLLSKRLVDKVLKPECNDISLWDPSISVITQSSQDSRFTCSYRSESYMEAVSPDNTTQRLTFSLATEPDYSHCVSRKVKGTENNRHNNTLVTETSMVSSCPGYETDVDVTIGTEEGVSWTDETLNTEASDPHSYGAENRGFMSDDEIMNNSCQLESDYYTDDESFATPIKRKHSARIVEDQIYSEKYHNDGNASDDTAESIDEYWLICSPKSQEKFVEHLVKEECRFNINMERGIKKYLWASRRVLTGDDFRVIFQNAEKLLAISNFVQQQMREELDRSEVTHFKAVLDVYRTKTAMLLQAYSTYVSGLNQALQRLDECKLHSLDFQQFLHEAWEQERHLSVDDFLMLPVQHLSNIRSIFSEMAEKCQHDQHVVKMLRCLGEVLDQAPFNTEIPCTPVPTTTKFSHM